MIINSLIIAGGCSGFEPNADLVTQFSIGTVTAALQLQQGGINLSNKNDISNPISSDRPMANPPLGAPSIDQSIPVITQSDPLITSNSFSSSVRVIYLLQVFPLLLPVCLISNHCLLNLIIAFRL